MARLESGGSALDAVEEAIVVMEDDETLTPAAAVF